MNYPFTEAVIDFIAKGKIGASRFGNLLTSHLQLYPENVNEVLFNLLGSHDTARVLTQCGDDTAKLKLAFLLLFTYPGSPCIYYGDELGLKGDGDDFAYYRACMEWDPAKQDQDLLSFVKRLIAIRKSHSAITANCHLQVLKADDASGLFVFSRSQGDEEIVVALNNGEEPSAFSLPSKWHGQNAVDLWSGEKVAVGAETASYALEPMQFRIFAINK